MQSEAPMLSLSAMDEGRKRTLAVVTAVLLVPRIGNLAWDGRSGNPAGELAEWIKLIDRKYPRHRLTGQGLSVPRGYCHRTIITIAFSAARVMASRRGR
jgi:hypothetical protein